MPRKKRRRITINGVLQKNIYQDNHGYEIIVTRNGIPDRKRFDRDTSPQALKAARETMIGDLAIKAAQRQPGTLAGDIPVYLATLPRGRARDDRAYELKPWLTPFGALHRTEITGQMVREQLAAWHGDNIKASTLNHRRQALRSLYKTLDGPDAPTPCDHVKKYTERHQVRDIPLVCVLAILRRVPNTKFGARIKVIARTGFPHAQVKRIQPDDLHLASRTIDVKPRRKGKGVAAKRLPLTVAAARAFRLFDRLNAYGSFSNSALHKVFTHAVTAAKEHWPTDTKGPWPGAQKIRPYDLRHAFLTEVYRRTKDLRATAELGMHSTVVMTARYAEAAVTDTASAARDAMDRTGMALHKKTPKNR